MSGKAHNFFRTSYVEFFASIVGTIFIFTSFAGVPAKAALSCSVTTTCSSPNVVAFNMASVTNSHVELPSQSNYTNLVCCGGVASLSNSCTGSYGVLLNLASITNSHAEENTVGTFTNPVCLSIPSGSVTVGYQANNCNGYDTAVASLVSASNSHVGTSTAYTTEVCASASANSLTFITDASSENFPAFTPGSLVATSSILTVTTGNTDGFNITAARVNSSATLLLNTNNAITFPDKTAWSAPGATTTAGNAVASTTNPLTLQFRVRKSGTDTADFASSWWGSDDTTANALFAGFPTTAQYIINRSTSAVSTTTAYVSYDLNAPVTQQTGTYTGGITYSATANP